MTLKDVLLPILWVGTNHPYWYVHPIVSAATKPGQTPVTRHIDAVLMEMYGLNNPVNQLRKAIFEIDDEDPESWFNHLSLFEEQYETPCGNKNYQPCSSGAGARY